MRWTLVLQEYDIKIQHISGRDNTGVDTLTRYPQENEEPAIGGNNPKIITLNALKKFTYSKELQEQISKLPILQKQDKKIELEYKNCKQPNQLYTICDKILF